MRDAQKNVSKDIFIWLQVAFRESGLVNIASMLLYQANLICQAAVRIPLTALTAFQQSLQFVKVLMHACPNKL